MARQFLPVFQTAATVDALKATLKAKAQSTDAAVQACTGLPDAQRAAWGLFYASILKFAASDSSIWTAATEATQAEQHEDELYQWQQQLQGSCPGVAAINPQPPEPPGQSVLKWAAVAVIVAAAAYATHEIVSIVKPIEKAALPESPAV